MKKNNWNSILAELQNTNLPTIEVAKKHKVNITTLRHHCKKIGYNLIERNYKIRESRLDNQWDEIKDTLDNTNMNIKDVAAKLHITHPKFISYLKSKNYDLKARNYRVRQAAAQRGVNTRYNNPSTERKLDAQIIMDQRKECLSKDGKSLIAHRLPLNELAQVYA